MANTPHLGITLLEQSQAQKEVTVNEAFYRIDALLNSGVIDKDLATPPSTPAQGDVYIVAASSTDAWSGKAGQVAYFDQIWRFIVPKEGLMLWVADENKRYLYNGAAWEILEAGGGGGGGSGDMEASAYDPANIAQQMVGTTATQTLTNKTLTAPIINGNVTGSGLTYPADGRLTLSSGVPVTTADVTGAMNIYYTPYVGNKIALYTGSTWVHYTFSELILVLGTLTSSKPYDVFLDYNGGSPQLALLAWTNDTTRATALAYQHGVLVKSGVSTQRYLGTFYTTSTTTTEDSKAKRFVWNMYHRRARQMSVLDGTNSWNYSTAAYRQANGSAANQLDFVCGIAEDSVRATAVAGLTSTAAVTVTTSIGLDSTSAKTAEAMNSFIRTDASGSPVTGFAVYEGVPPAGRHYLAWLEFGGGGGTQTWYGDNGGAAIQNGITGSVWG